MLNQRAAASNATNYPASQSATVPYVEIKQDSPWLLHGMHVVLVGQLSYLCSSQRETQAEVIIAILRVFLIL